MPPTKKQKVVADEGVMDPKVAALMEFVNKKMKGRAQLKQASKYVLPFATKRLSTGLLNLDVALRGGFPAGGISQIVGPKNAGKTYLVWQVIRQMQFWKGEDCKVLLAMTEMRADRTQARSAGVEISLGDDDIEALNAARVEQGVPKFTKEEEKILRKEVGTILETHGDSAEDLFDVVLRAVDDNVFDLIVIDSFGSIMSKAEAESESLNEKTYGGAAKPITEFLRKLCSRLTMDDAEGKARDVCIIGINQVRDAIGQANVEFRSTGGRALEHAKFVDLFVSSGKQLGFEDQIYTSDGTKKRFVQTGKEVNWHIQKGKAGIHEGARGSYFFDFATGSANFYLDTLVAGVRHGVVEAAGAWLGIPNPEAPGKYLLRENGKEAFIKALADDAALRAQEGDVNSYMNYIRQMVFNKLGIHVSNK
jgi:RecA/RadA recombinase